jgi:hypothetical protein
MREMMGSYYKVYPDSRPTRQTTRLVRSKGKLLELDETRYLDQLLTESGEVISDDELMSCKAFPPEPLAVTVKYDGKPLDFSFTLAQVPIVNLRVASILNELAGNDIQLIPAQVRGHSGQYAVLNVLRSEDCINEDLSADSWIDVARAKEAKILRPHGMHVVLLVEQEVRDALVQAKFTGIEFWLAR